MDEETGFGLWVVNIEDEAKVFGLWVIRIAAVAMALGSWADEGVVDTIYTHYEAVSHILATIINEAEVIEGKIWKRTRELDCWIEASPRASFCLSSIIGVNG